MGEEYVMNLESNLNYLSLLLNLEEKKDCKHVACNTKSMIKAESTRPKP